MRKWARQTFPRDVDADGVVWRGVAWRGVMYGGVVWCGVEWCGVMRFYVM